MTESLKTDVLIIGGGVAGLWLLNRLRNEGYQAWLLEQDALGAGQSIASQGMIHGGIKYALGGALTQASAAIADMPAHWKRCLDGQGDVDLRGCRTLSEAYYMWPRSSFRSRLNAFLGSKALEAKVDAVARPDYPAFFRDRIPGPLYRLQDIVLDIPSLLETLASRQKENIFRIDWRQATLARDGAGNMAGITFSNGQRLEARRYIVTCGAGAQALLENAGFDFAPMQRRPLRMVMVRHAITDPVYVHCVSDKLSMTPELTITSHRNARGEPVWYLGGELAERGAGQSEQQLLAAAREKLAALFPWCDFSGAAWATLAIDRAEGRQPDGRRPDTVSIALQGNLMVCWPTKLTLAPNLGNAVLASLRDSGLAPGAPPAALPGFLPQPTVAPTPWESL